MSDYGPIYVTEEGLTELKEELNQLINVKRPDISDRLEKAIAEGDLKENADYHDAKHEQSLMEGRIRFLEDSLRRAEVIKEDIATDKVRVGSTVTILDTEYDEEETYRIVGVYQADPSKGFISNESPIGRALLGKKKGAKVKVETPGGEAEFKIKSIE